MISILRPDRQQIGAISRLVSDVFFDGQDAEGCAEHYIGGSHYDWDVSRLVMDGDRIIHHWGVWGYSMWVESVELRVAGVGAVATDPGHLQQGWMHQAAEASFKAMAEDGYDLSMLQGPHYVKMGYGRAWNGTTYRVKYEDLPDLGLRQPYRPLLPEEVGEMDALYNQAHAHCTGAAIRPTYRNRAPQDICVYAWFNGGKLDGYVRANASDWDPKTMECSEAAGDPQQGLAVVRDLYLRGNADAPYERLIFRTLPYLHPISQQLRKGSMTVEQWFSEKSGWRVKLVNLGGALRKLVPLFERRLAHSQFASWQGELVLDAGGQRAQPAAQAVLRLDRGRVAVRAGLDRNEPAGEHVLRDSAARGNAIARFLIGSDEPDEIIRQAEMTCTGCAAPLAQVLFPNLHPMLSAWDEY